MQLRNSGRGYSPVHPKSSTICCALVAVAQVGEGSLSLIFFVPRIRPVKTVSTGQVFSRFSSRLWRGILSSFFPLLFPPVLQLFSPSMPLLTKYWAGHHLSISESCIWNCLSKIGTQTPIAGTLCYVWSLSHICLGLEPGQNPQCLALGPNEAQVLDVSLQKFNERHNDR